MKKQRTIKIDGDFKSKFYSKVDHTLNENARYSLVQEDEQEYDELPGEGQPSVDNPTDNTPPTGPLGDEPEMPEVPGDDTPEPEPPVEPEKDVDEIQNEIIKHNIEAMKAIHDQFENLNNTVETLNQKLDMLGNEVEQVREPSNSEKLMKQKYVSHPYYNNLNDVWGDNWFDNKYSKKGDVDNTGNPQTGGGNKDVGNGIIELPDGTFIADFDDLVRFLDSNNVKDSY